MNFDATGSIFTPIKRQKKPFLYSLVFRDCRFNSIIPFADYISTSHDQINIAKFLTSIKIKIEQCTKERVLPRIIVVDHSYALINSIMSSFNNLKIEIYLKWCFDSIFNNLWAIFNKLALVKVYLCSTHFLKNIIKKSK